MDRELRSVCSSSSDGDDGRPDGSRLMSYKVPCELCNEAACLYCAADEARLCWDCDAVIHSANFLVARHPRALICPSCGVLTSGPLHLGPLPILQFCPFCTDRSLQLASDWRDSDEESKVDCSDDSTDDTQCLRQSPLERCPSAAATQKRCPDASHGSWTEGVGDSEEDDYTHPISAGTLHIAAPSDCEETARYKRRKLTLCF